MVGIERGHSSLPLPAPLAPWPGLLTKAMGSPCPSRPHHLGCHGASTGHCQPRGWAPRLALTPPGQQPERDAKSPPRPPHRWPHRKWPPVFANIVARGWEGLGPPQRAPLCRADPWGLISMRPGRSPRSFQPRSPLRGAPEPGRSSAKRTAVPQSSTVPMPGAHTCNTRLPSRCLRCSPTAWLLSWSVPVPPKATEGLRASRWRTHPCTVPAPGVPKPPPQLSEVPWAGRRLCPAWHSQCHEGRWAPRSSQHAPCVPSSGVTPSSLTHFGRPPLPRPP